MPAMTGQPCVKSVELWRGGAGSAGRARLPPGAKSHEPFNQQEAERYLPDFWRPTPAGGGLQGEQNADRR